MWFSKYHGTGNDFVMVEDLDDRLRLDQDLIAALCDRSRGVGADGLIRIVRADDADFLMDYFNADGATAEMCGNGIRCLAKYVYDRGITAALEIDVATRAGRKRLAIHATNGVADSVTVDMGPPMLERKAIPMAGDPGSTFQEQTLQVEGRTFVATALSMGNPHCVLFVEDSDDLAAMEVRRLGPLVETLPKFPNGTNVEFVKVVDGRVLVRVWERGSGETLACGTGACASLVASAVSGRTGREADVEFPGGLLRVAWPEGGPVFLTGPAIHVFDGELDERWVRAASRGSER
jgi:diaminopimelate epimerase